MNEYFQQVKDQMATASERLKEVGYTLAAAKAEATKKNLDDCIDSIGAAERRVRRAQKFVNRATAAVNDEIEEFLEDNSESNNPTVAIDSPLVADSRLDQLSAQLTAPAPEETAPTLEQRIEKIRKESGMSYAEAKVLAQEQMRGEQTAKAIKEAKAKGLWFN